MENKKVLEFNGFGVITKAKGVQHNRKTKADFVNYVLILLFGDDFRK